MGNIGDNKKIVDNAALGRRASYDPQPRKSSETYLTIEEGLVFKPKTSDKSAHQEFDNLEKWKEKIVDRSTKYKMHSPIPEAIVQDQNTKEISLVMSLCAGKSLEEILSSDSKLPLKEDIVSILEHLGALFKLKQDSSLKHGDLSLKNIFVNKDPENKSLSLGVAGLSKLVVGDFAQEHDSLINKVKSLLASEKFNKIFKFSEDEIDASIQRGKNS